MSNVYRNLFGAEFSYKSLVMLVILAILPNLLGLVVLQTPFGFKLHIFQLLIFFAAAYYGKWGGALSGGFGSIFTAVLLGNPYIIVGNIILGFFTGMFAKRINLVSAAMIAFAIQLPWLWYTDLFLVGMPIVAVNAIMWALLFSNLVWAGAAMLLFKRIRFQN
ncbi:MAG: hypothetical protein CL943_00015 [Candidatus Diapherotrites archaeon]|uniref:ECF transporter S component n=1 Tax=Candidatus Iainarchaeum sp. TaxID=3101447 RepID=A0A2D6LZR8_9ARCH|nr:hypothetical protein [Candidatus Diapherotrites archaeon]|tara:strand:- start:1244 stop:1732 length:489 start_codon:yes stop_codon:yes gene_type:complete